ncbi:MAG: amidohydrolase, partial [Dehalococcoidia bacterium]
MDGTNDGASRIDPVQIPSTSRGSIPASANAALARLAHCSRLIPRCPGGRRSGFHSAIPTIAAVPLNPIAHHPPGPHRSTRAAYSSSGSASALSSRPIGTRRPPIPRIDAHIHAFPERLALAVRGRLDSAGRLTSSPHLPEIAAEVQATGFDRGWILPYAHRAGVAESLNEWVAAEVTRYAWLVPGSSFHPDDEAFPALVKHAFTDLGLRVVKLHCSVGAYSPADPRLRPLWAAAASEGVPILIHVGQNSPGNTDASELDALGPVLDAHPRLNIVLAHTGHPTIEAALSLMSRHDNLYADVTPVWLNEIKVTPATLEAHTGRF